MQLRVGDHTFEIGGEHGECICLRIWHVRREPHTLIVDAVHLTRGRSNSEKQGHPAPKTLGLKPPCACPWPKKVERLRAHL